MFTLDGVSPAEMGDRIVDNLPGASDTTKDIQDAGAPAS